MALRLGYGSQGAASATLRDVFNEYLQDAQEQLFEYVSDALLTDFEDNKTLNEGQNLYDINDAADPDRISDVNIYINGIWMPLKHGISMYNRSDDESGQPNRYMIKYGTTNEAQIEIQPTPDKEYRLGYVYQRGLAQFSNNDDKSTLPSRMVLTLALGNAAAHYGRKNADLLIRQANGLLGQLRARANDNVVITRGTRLKPHKPGMADFQEKINNIVVEQDFIINEVGNFLIDG